MPIERVLAMPTDPHSRIEGWICTPAADDQAG
jgi:hypothetical protein